MRWTAPLIGLASLAVGYAVGRADVGTPGLVVAIVVTVAVALPLWHWLEAR